MDKPWCGWVNKCRKEKVGVNEEINEKEDENETVWMFFFFPLVIMQEKNYEEELVLEKEKTVKILCVTICPASNFENDFTL